MRLYYWHKIRNFGDELNAWLWPQLIADLLQQDDELVFMGIGTLLNSRVPDFPQPRIVFGSGVGYGPPLRLDARWNISCLRGPLSAKALGLPASLAVTDPAALVARVPLPPASGPFDIAYMPHIDSIGDRDWAGTCRALGMHFISPRGSVPDVLAEIRGTRLLLTEAMHGAIVADTLRVPWVPILLHRHVLRFKWQDWLATVGLEYRPLTLQALFAGDSGALASGRRLRLHDVLERVRAVGGQSEPQLSSDVVLERVTTRLEELLAKVREDWRQPGRA